MVVHAAIPPAQEVKEGGLQVWGQPGQLFETLSQNKILKKLEYLSVVKHLSNMFEALGSILSTSTKKKSVSLTREELKDKNWY
jgi:hypothetical protein